MQSAGQAVIGGIASPDSVAAYIRDIMALGYNKDIHVGFKKFVVRHIESISLDKWPQTKTAGGDALIRRVGEILVGWAVLEAAGKLTMKSRLPNNCRRKDFLSVLQFGDLPEFGMDAFPYTPIASTLRHFGKVYVLADSGDYDDIFNQILRWRTDEKEPFNRHYYNQAKNMSDYHARRVHEEEEEARKKREKEIRDRERAKIREWAVNTARDLHDKGKRAEVAAELESMPLGRRLAAIADSDYMLHYYRPRLRGWGKLFAENNSVSSLKADSRNRLTLKLKKRSPLGWEDVKRQLSEIA